MFRFCLCILILISISTHDCVATEKYNTKYDTINVDEVIGNRRVLEAYSKCLLDQGKCTNEGAELKRILPDALATNCMSCSPKQRMAAMRIIAFLTANRPDIWKNLSAKYDPRGVYKKNYRNM